MSPFPRGGRVDDAPKGRVVTQVIGKPRVSERILDFRPRVETEPADQPITDPPMTQAFFQHSRLRIGPVEDSHAPLPRLGYLPRHFAGHEFGFLIGAAGLE